MTPGLVVLTALALLGVFAVGVLAGWHLATRNAVAEAVAAAGGHEDALAMEYIRGAVDAAELERVKIRAELAVVSWQKVREAIGDACPTGDVSLAIRRAVNEVLPRVRITAGLIPAGTVADSERTI